MADIVRPDAVVVDRVVDAPVDEIVDQLTEFAVQNGLQLDPRHTGAGMRFTRHSAAEVEGTELFRRGDELVVVIAADPGGGSLISCSATMGGLHQRGDDWKRGRAIRGGLLTAMFAWFGARGLVHPDVGTAVMFGLAGMFGMRTYRAVTNEENDRREFEDDVARALAALCDRIEAGDEFD